MRNGKVYTKYSLIAHVLPKANPIYVGDAESSITLQSGNSELYSVSVVAGQGEFDSSQPGETSTTVQFKPQRRELEQRPPECRSGPC